MKKLICVITFDEASAKFVNGAKLYRKKQPLAKTARQRARQNKIVRAAKCDSTAV